MASTEYVHVVSDIELQTLWGISDRALAKLVKRGDFPPPTTPPQDKPGVWRSIPAMREWLAETGYRKPAALTLDWWPASSEVAEFGGAQRVTSRYRVEDTVLQHWYTGAGHLVVAWHPDPFMVGGEELARMAPDADTYVLVGADWGRRGPALWCWPGQHPDVDRVEVCWRDLARVLGRAAPFWPERLRKADLIAAWEPGQEPVRDVGEEVVATAPLTRMALQYPPEHVVHRAMIYTAQVIDQRSEATDSSDLSILQEHLDQGWITSDDIVLAALPAPAVTDDRPADIDPTVTRAGWREVLGRADRLAEQCVRTLMAWDSGEPLPWSQTLRIPHSPARAEFLDRLEPPAERTAIYAALDRGNDSARGIALVDPLTDIPVLLPTEPDGHVRALAPQRLSTTSPLAAIILEPEIWIRTQDGTLYPAPLGNYGGLSWGYSGSGPQALAALAHRLLTDITAPAPTLGDRHDTPEGLLELFRHEWEPGTIITREQLEHACR